MTNVHACLISILCIHVLSQFRSSPAVLLVMVTSFKEAALMPIFETLRSGPDQSVYSTHRHRCWKNSTGADGLGIICISIPTIGGASYEDVFFP